MPDSALTAAIKEAYAAAPSGVIIYHTLEIYHPTFSVPIRVVRDVTDLTAALELTAPRDAGASVTFTGYAFDVVKPEVSATGVPQCTIQIDNVARDIVANIELAVGDSRLVQVIFREFLSTDLTAPQNNPPLQLTISSIDVDVFRVKATATFGDLSNRRFPSVEYTSEVFPGLLT